MRYGGADAVVSTLHRSRQHLASQSRQGKNMKNGAAYQHIATHRNTQQHTATHCNTLQHIATHYNTLQLTATHRNTPQHTATRAANL